MRGDPKFGEERPQIHVSRGQLGQQLTDIRERLGPVEEAAQVIAPDDPAAALRLTALLDESRRSLTTARIEGRWQGLVPRRFLEASGRPR
jgi:hypothetical protein